MDSTVSLSLGRVEDGGGGVGDQSVRHLLNSGSHSKVDTFYSQNIKWLNFTVIDLILLWNTDDVRVWFKLLFFLSLSTYFPRFCPLAQNTSGAYVCIWEGAREREGVPSGETEQGRRKKWQMWGPVPVWEVRVGTVRHVDSGAVMDGQWGKTDDIVCLSRVVIVQDCCLSCLSISEGKLKFVYSASVEWFRSRPWEIGGWGGRGCKWMWGRYALL